MTERPTVVEFAGMKGFEASSREITVAFFNALREVQDVAKTETADTGKYTYSYASLGAVLDEIKRACEGEGLAVTQTLTIEDPYLAVVTTLVSGEGDTLTFAPTKLRSPVDAQPLGSAATYLRRYSLLAAFAIAPEDDDGRSAVQPVRALIAPANVDRIVKAWEEAGLKVGEIVSAATNGRTTNPSELYADEAAAAREAAKALLEAPL